MIGVKDAIQRAFAFVLDVFGAEEISDPRLEEVEHSDEEYLWLITVSFVRRPKVVNPSALAREAAELVCPPTTREYRQVQVNDETGDVTAVKFAKAG
jgi:hypothetical protein